MSPGRGSIPRQTDWQTVSRNVTQLKPCGGGVEYLHRDPASHRRRRKGKYQNWDSRIWSRDPRVTDPIKTALAMTRSICKRQTRPLVREGAPPQRQNRNCQTVTNIWPWTPDGARYQDRQTDRSSVAMWLRLRQFPGNTNLSENTPLLTESQASFEVYKCLL
jgi:hypothetical protein